MIRFLSTVDDGRVGVLIIPTVANLAPQAEPDSQDHESRLNSSHQGISFDQWLGLFLDYAVGLAMTGRREEAYQVCAAARDSNAFQSPDHNFAIHVTWSGKYTPSEFQVRVPDVVYDSVCGLYVR